MIVTFITICLLTIIYPIPVAINFQLGSRSIDFESAGTCSGFGAFRIRSTSNPWQLLHSTLYFHQTKEYFRNDIFVALVVIITQPITLPNCLCSYEVVPNPDLFLSERINSIWMLPVTDFPVRHLLLNGMVLPIFIL